MPLSRAESISTSSINSGGGVSPLELSNHNQLQWAASEHQTSNNLRHRTEYERIKTLGKGAFGITYLVRNVVDNRLYALKCIRIGDTIEGETSKNILREVEALSALRSDNVVRYYSAWIERGEIDEDYIDCKGSGSASFSSGFGYSSNTATDETASKQNGNEETCNLCHQQYTDWVISYEQWGLIDAVLQPLNLCTKCYKNSLPANIDISAIDIREKKMQPLSLFILMEYGGDTLSDVMREIPNKDDALRWSIFAQCVQGIYSIHEQGFYHRDIKPGNIFMSVQGIVKIGDLGLSIDSDIESSASVGSTGVGTLLYSAPEVDDGRYEAADIYSLGVVLIELFSGFTTVMERVSVLSKIREGHLPESWMANSDTALLARKMVDLNPTERPNAREILQQLVEKGLLEDPDKKVLVKQLQSNIDKLEKRVLEKDEEVKYLRQLLSNNGIDVPIKNNNISN